MVSIDPAAQKALFDKLLGNLYAAGKSNQVVAMSEFETIIAGLKQAATIQAGTADPATYRVHVPSWVDVKSIRRRLGLTQAAFAAKFGFSFGAVRDWEQGRRTPEASARVLLLVIDHSPETVLAALDAA